MTTNCPWYRSVQVPAWPDVLYESMILEAKQTLDATPAHIQWMRELPSPTKEELLFRLALDLTSTIDRLREVAEYFAGRDDGQ